MKKNYKWITGTLVALVMIVTGWMAWNSHEPSKDVAGASKKLATLQTKLKKVSRESYSVLGINVGENKKTIVDVLSPQRWNKEQIKSYETTLFNQVYEQNHAIKDMTIHVFDNKKDYERAVSEGYKGNFGLVQTIASTHKANSPAITLTSYSHPDKDKQGDIDAVAYDVKNAQVNDTSAIIDVVTGEGTVTIDSLSEFIYPFIQVTKDLNPELKHYTLHFYSSNEQYQAKNIMGSFEGELLVVTEQIQ